MERLGLGPDECLGRNPRLVYGRMTGWGQTGFLARTAGHDINYIALTGALHAIGPKDGPPVAPLNLVGDFGGGSLYLALGLLAALLDASRSRRGQVVDAAMVDGAASLMTLFYGFQSQGSWSDSRGENMLDGGAPWYSVYATADGRHVAVGALEERFYDILVEKLGFAQGELPDRKDRATWPVLRDRFAAAFMTRTMAAWAEHFAGSDACVSPVLSLIEAPYHPHNRERGTFVETAGALRPGPAPRFSGSHRPVGLSAEIPRVEPILRHFWDFSTEDIERVLGGRPTD
jgi:alpha-methylacyl-CoA racemase